MGDVVSFGRAVTLSMPDELFEKIEKLAEAEGMGVEAFVQRELDEICSGGLI